MSLARHLEVFFFFGRLADTQHLRTQAWFPEQ